MHNKSFKFIDLFAGIGGLRMGFEAMGGECVFTSEWNKYSQITYRKNFPDDKHEIAGDIREINEEDIPQFDLLLAGFPCQPFSIAGVSKKKSLGRDHGFLDKTQGTLFFDIARIVNHHKPSAFVLENVKNLLSHDRGNTFKVIKETLENIGYNIHYKIIDAKSFLPQHRERIFIVGFKDNVDFTWNGILDSAPTEQKKMNSVLHPEDGSESSESPYTEGVNATVAKKYYLSDKMWNFLQAYAAKQKNKGNGFGYGLVGPSDTCRTLLARYYKDGSEILVDNVNGNPRRLTPRECSRLMGFDTDNKKFIIPVSDTQAYRQFGNAVAVPVAKAVAALVVPKIAKGD